MKMNAKYILFIICLISLFGIHSSTQISFDSPGEGNSVNNEGTVLTISSEGEYEMSGEFSDKGIIVAASCKLTFEGLSIYNSESLTPLLINENIAVEINLMGETNLQDSSSNENDGTIYLKAGASLTFSGEGIIHIYPNKMMGINGTDDTSLTVNGAVSIKIESNSENAGGIYLRKSITFNSGDFVYTTEFGTNHAIDTEGEVRIINGIIL